jgi:hypothetical protein
VGIDVHVKAELLHSSELPPESWWEGRDLVCIQFRHFWDENDHKSAAALLNSDPIANMKSGN